MGATFVVETIEAATRFSAFQTFLATFKKYDVDDSGESHWKDPQRKPGHTLVWAKPVPGCATDWMIGWTRRHPPAGVKPEDKWGPWLTFQLESGAWVFFGWVNT